CNCWQFLSIILSGRGDQCVDESFCTGILPEYHAQLVSLPNRLNERSVAAWSYVLYEANCLNSCKGMNIPPSPPAPPAPSPSSTPSPSSAPSPPAPPAPSPPAPPAHPAPQHAQRTHPQPTQHLAELSLYMRWNVYFFRYFHVIRVKIIF
uniref:Uncharacterized protein n=1 Tax=Oncorhynchus tshawytscha TaxID=74940 RepID=A0AAZ3RYG9_ONCTS